MSKWNNAHLAFDSCLDADHPHGLFYDYDQMTILSCNYRAAKEALLSNDPERQKNGRQMTSAAEVGHYDIIGYVKRLLHCDSFTHNHSLKPKLTYKLNTIS